MDLIIPVTLHSAALMPKNVTAVLVWVKNDLKYKDTIHCSLFTSMNPVKLGVFPNEVATLPVVCMVFMLASKQPSVTVLICGLRRRPDEYTAFNIWCVGCCNQSFNIIPVNKNSAYQSMLNCTQQFTYQATASSSNLDFETDITTIQRRMHPGVLSSDAAHWDQFFEGLPCKESDESNNDMDTL